MDKENFKAFETTITRNMTSINDFSNETRNRQLRLEQTVKGLENIVMSLNSQLTSIQTQLAAIQTTLYSGVTG
jgi:flagellar capping protein FliD